MGVEEEIKALKGRVLDGSSVWTWKSPRGMREAGEGSEPVLGSSRASGRDQEANIDDSLSNMRIHTCIPSTMPSRL